MIMLSFSLLCFCFGKQQNRVSALPQSQAQKAQEANDSLALREAGYALQKASATWEARKEAWEAWKVAEAASTQSF